MIYSPPGYLTFEKLFKKVSLRSFDGKADLSQLVTGNTIYDLDDDNRAKIEKIINNPMEAAGHCFVINRIDIRSSVESKSILLTCASFCDDQYIFNPKSGGDWTWNTNFLRQAVHITKIFKIIRDSLCSTINTENDEPFSFLQHNGQNGFIPNDVWMNDNNWYGLIYDGKLPSDAVIQPLRYRSERGVVCFDEKLVDKILTENAVIPLNQITSNFIQKINDGSIAFRAAERLYQLFKNTHPVEFTHGTNIYKINDSKYKKENLVDYIIGFAEKNGFKVVSPQTETEYDIETSVSKQDIQSITNLLRSLPQQGR